MDYDLPNKTKWLCELDKRVDSEAEEFKKNLKKRDTEGSFQNFEEMELSFINLELQKMDLALFNLKLQKMDLDIIELERMLASV